MSIVENEMEKVFSRIEIILGDITKQKIEAIVNAANTTLLGGGGVDGAIHRAAGPVLLEECMKLKGCPTGEAKITKGHSLPAKWVIHTVGPVWRGGDNKEDEYLASCYENCFKLVKQYGIKTIAFPSISTGAYRFPVKRACQIALTAAKRFLEKDSSIEKVIFVCFDQHTFNCYRESLIEK